MTDLGMSVWEFVDWSEVGRSTLNVASNIPWAGAWTELQKKANRVPALTALGFLLASSISGPSGSEDLNPV